MKILTTALYSFIIEVLWILNTVRYNWSLSYTHRNTDTTTDWRLTLPTPLVLSLNQVISYKPWTHWLNCSSIISIEWNNCVCSPTYLGCQWQSVLWRMREREMLILWWTVWWTVWYADYQCWRDYYQVVTLGHDWARNVDISSLGSDWPTSAHLGQHWALTGWAGAVTESPPGETRLMSAEIITVINMEIFWRLYCLPPALPCPALPDTKY